MKITDYLAIYAALLSTLVFLWNLVQSRPRIRVDLIFGIETSEGKHLAGVYAVIRNLSSHDVHLARVSLLYPYRKAGLFARWKHLWTYKRLPRRVGWVSTSLSNYGLTDGCPLCLEARKSHSVFIPNEKLEELLSGAARRQLRAAVQDQLWQNTYSRAFVLPAPKAGSVA